MSEGISINTSVQIHRPPHLKTSWRDIKDKRYQLAAKGMWVVTRRYYGYGTNSKIRLETGMHKVFGLLLNLLFQVEKYCGSISTRA